MVTFKFLPVQENTLGDFLQINMPNLAKTMLSLKRDDRTPEGTFGWRICQPLLPSQLPLSYRYFHFCSAHNLSSICGWWIVFSMLLQITASGTAAPSPWKFSHIKYCVSWCWVYFHSRNHTENWGHNFLL